jgi:hypothetical protein
MSELEPFITDGISLGIPNDTDTVEKIDNAIFLDEDGNMHFRDAYVRSLVNILGEDVDSITLEDLAGRMQGVYMANGKLYFQDSTTSRPYSLEEIIGAYIKWKDKLTNGGIFWIGRTQVTMAECDNIIVNIEGDPTLPPNEDESRIYIKDNDGNYSTNATGTQVFSLDQYLLEADADDEFSGGDFKTLPSGLWRWHDIPNLEILIPPVNTNISSHILAKTNVRMVQVQSPVVFRLYDETAEEELDRVAIANDADEPVEQQVTLTHVGALTNVVEGLQQVNCQCPSVNQDASVQEEPPHRLKVQFYVNEILTDNVVVTTQTALMTSGECALQDESVTKYVGVERRLVGLPNNIADEPIVNSSIDVLLYNVDPDDNVGRKSGNVTFTNKDIMQVEFDSSFSSTGYSISLSTNKNINIWHTNKKPSGFTIRAEKKFTGIVDWSALLTISEGEA